MTEFRGEYKNFWQRFFTLRNLDYFINCFVATSLIVIFNLEKIYTIIIGSALLIISVYFTIYKSRNNIHLIAFEKNTIILFGETFNTQWKKVLDIKKTNIELKCIASRQVCGTMFYFTLKNVKNSYNVNLFNTFSDEKIIQMFTEFKNNKKEKIIIDEKLIIIRIQNKIEKCQ
ncbi:hypothetical protein [Flavobacterium anhuiense]|uniref:hypothetical protein n=1 Tax=Flavobacterium anhuiense TaxID=459526 RepID=UPI000E6CFD2D|nr:hypothetical protein [Flavobacterium anhuiense]